MAEAFADDLDGDAGGDEQAGVGVAEVVEAYGATAGSVAEPFEGLGDGVGVDGGAVAVSVPERQESRNAAMCLAVASGSSM